MLPVLRHALALACAAAVAASAVAFAGCSTSSSSSPADASTGDAQSCDPIDSACGQPCDPGNALGVGAFCTSIGDCLQLPQAHLCSSLGSVDTHFCTLRCSLPDAQAPDGGDGGLAFPTDCGQGAICACDQQSNCGCTPNRCVGR